MNRDDKHSIAWRIVERRDAMRRRRERRVWNFFREWAGVALGVAVVFGLFFVMMLVASLVE